MSNFVFPTHGESDVSAAEAESLPSVEEILPRNLEASSDLQRSSDEAPKKFLSSMAPKQLVEFKAKFSLPNHVELIPINEDEVYVHRPGYCALYAYP